ncbi:MAG TPA: tRNA-intron lyase, partial [Methanomicrobiales archaeon]|nr:tRNA-intron lyase [Methanomicrobiales archaeon]
LVNFEVMTAEATASLHMRKQHVLAVVDDENELTYYEVKLQNLPPLGERAPLVSTTATLFGSSAIVKTPAPSPLEEAFFGKRLDSERLILSHVEAVYLMQKGELILKRDDQVLSTEDYIRIAGATDVELAEKSQVYASLRDRGYIPRTGYKFGHHFRVYVGMKSHSDLLVHAIPQGTALPMSTISRSVRLAHSVKKKMLFAYVHNTTEYIEFARIKL